MSKLLSVITVLLVVCLFTSAVGKNTLPGEGLAAGDRAPRFALSDVCSDSLRGQKVLITFWAAYDAESRASNALLAAHLRNQHADIRLVGIDFDASTTIFEETVRLDRLDPCTQHHVRDAEARELYKTFRLEKGFGNLLLDERGVIIAKNLDPERLSKLLTAKM